METTLHFKWQNTYIWILFMIIVQFIAMFLAKDAGKRAVDTSWYGKKEKTLMFWNFLFQFLLIGVSFFVPVHYGRSWLFATGTLLYILSFAGFVAAFHAYGTTPLNETVTRGVYRISRNPQYFFYNMSLVAVFLMTGCSLWILLPSALFIIAAHLIILCEEKYCERTYGENYVGYKKRTPRYFLFF